MELASLFSAGVNRTDALSRTELEEEKRKEKSLAQEQGAPASWGADRVSFSTEAIRAAQTASDERSEREKSGQEKSGQERNGLTSANSDSSDSLKAVEEFAAYMTSQRSRAQSSDPESQIRSLQSRLKQLENQLQQVVSSEGGDKGKDVQIETLRNQISDVMNQIADLAAQAAEQKPASGGGQA